MMELVVTTGAIGHAKFQSNVHRQQTNSRLFTGQMPFLSDNSVKAQKGRKYHTSRTCSPQLIWGSSKLVFDH